MGLDDSGEEVVGSSPSSLPSPVAEGEEPGGLLEAPCEEKADVQVRRVLWCCCVRVNDEDQSPAVEEALSGLQLDLLVPYSQLLLTSQAELPDSCLSFGIKAGQTCWFIFSEAEQLRQTRTELSVLLQVRQTLSVSRSLEVLLSSFLPRLSTPGKWRRVRELGEDILPTSSAPLPRAMSTSCLIWDSFKLQTEENQPSPHLVPGLSPGLKLLAGLGGQQLLTYFNRYVALPDFDLCRLDHIAVMDISNSGDSEASLCCCLSIRLSELQAVNVGLFDQYFRVVGKMQNYELIHSSKVKFIYPSEEEMGDLTFIVAERKTSASTASSSLSSCSILLYLLVFQVQIPSQCSAASGPSSSVSASDGSPVLQPRTLILTGTDLFLLDEDYVSYPLPDFAKEPPSRERYQLCEARRIRDLDRVLLGYQTYPQALTLVFDDLPGPDLLCHLTMDHFAATGEEAPPRGVATNRGAEGEVQWCIFIPGADCRERLISLLARQWEALCSRELPVELTG
ncbi:hypothetical protein GOODEAATRI_009144 [Goodea atripinnis]|uniref:Nischarin C-terminal PH domain-containing protein n=1 Tax=Goodea atripinnis TaxID=208336 RepID=A0ABV0MGC2_9TELE